MYANKRKRQIEGVVGSLIAWEVLGLYVLEISVTPSRRIMSPLCDAGPSVYISHKPLFISWDGNLIEWLDH